MTSRRFLAWCVEHGIEPVPIRPGRPMENGRLESFNGKLREECLRTSWFQNLFDARRSISAWREDYNFQWPHSSLGYRTPAEFAALHKNPLRSPTTASVDEHANAGGNTLI